jgi:hypothetical protein
MPMQFISPQWSKIPFWNGKAVPQGVSTVWKWLCYCSCRSEHRTDRVNSTLRTMETRQESPKNATVALSNMEKGLVE